MEMYTSEKMSLKKR